MEVQDGAQMHDKYEKIYEMERFKKCREWFQKGTVTEEWVRWNQTIYKDI